LEEVTEVALRNHNLMFFGLKNQDFHKISFQ